jgi:hypothetical protein
MSPRVSPLAPPVMPLVEDAFFDEDTLDEAGPSQMRQMAESFEDPSSSRAEEAWAEEVAEQVVALWEGRPGATPFAQALAKLQEQQGRFRR